jgi:hypothetical protein
MTILLSWRDGMPANWNDVIVKPQAGGASLLQNGTGSGEMNKFACGKFAANTRPTVNVQYSIQATPDGEQFPMDWTAKCTFSGETSEFG